jgi:hypothetical protein
VTFYTRAQVIDLLDVEAGFLLALEREEIVCDDAPEAGCYSEQMLERVRVAHQLVHELDVNLEGAAIILRMREDLAAARRDLADLAKELHRMRTGAERR